MCQQPRSPLDDLAHNEQSLLDLRGVMQGNFKKQSLADRTRYCGRNKKSKNRRIRAVQSSDMHSTVKATLKSKFGSRNVINPVVSASYESGDGSNSSFMDSGAYYGICYGSTHMTSQCRYIADPDKIVLSRNRNYISRFGREQDCRRKYPAENILLVVQQITAAPQE